MITCIFGKGNSGKTTWLRRHLPDPPYLIVDTLSQFSDHARADVQTVIARPDVVRRLAVTCDRDRLYYLLRMALAVGWRLVVDEIDWHVAPAYRDECARRTIASLRAIVAYGRHRGVDLLSSARNPTDVPRWLTRNADRLILYHLHEPADLAYFRRMLPAHVSVGILAQLPPWWYLDVCVWDGRVVLCGPKDQQYHCPDEWNRILTDAGRRRPAAVEVLSPH